jgi:uncharacterized membrane protein (UPF0127 family)
VLRRRLLVFASLALAFDLSGVAASDAPRLEAIVIETDRASLDLTVEIADTPELRERGLMFRHRLGEGRGMLFLYERAQPVAMWMKNTYIALDMVFVRDNGTVSEIVRNTVPLSLETIQSGEPVKAVLEIAAGKADLLGLKPGAVIKHRSFGNAD